MELPSLQAISPIDGRYHTHTKGLNQFFSEKALIKYRVKVEVEYFIALCEIGLPQLAEIDAAVFPKLRSIYEELSTNDATEIKEIEKTTNHDVKAVEYFLKSKFDDLSLSDYQEFIHFALTSQDVNNTAFPLMLKEGLEHELLPLLNEILERLDHMSNLWGGVALLARTHGQPASPTTVGKELEVFSARIKNQLTLLEQVPHAAKFGGATGNFNAHVVTYPNIDWKSFADGFVGKLGLTRSQPTTQIEHYDHLAAQCDNLKRINTILIDLCRDVWQYIAMNYFKQKIKEGEVGSSTMPHKVNPIDFENAEGNLGIANALYEHLSAKLPISRLQRDLTDSTVLRNIGVPVAHSFIALKSLEKGLNKLELNKEVIDQDLNNNWAVVAEGIQSILRREGYPKPYEALKDLTRNNEVISPEVIHSFIDSLNVPEAVREELKAITPFNYIGIK